MSDEPAVIEPSPAEGSIPFDHALVVYPSNSNRVVDLEPPPYVANPVLSVVGADRGLGIRHIENSLIVTFERWFRLNVGDVFEFYMGGSPFELAWAEVRPGEENRSRYQLAIPRELVPLGFVSSCYGRVVRVGSGTESTSVPQTWLIKDTRPGGVDQDPGLPYHSALKLHLPLDLQRPGSVLDPDRAALGVVLTIDRYPEMRIRDTIELYWNGHLVTLQLDADHISGARPLEVRVEPEIINRPHGSGLLTIRFRVRDEVLNFSGELQQWSQVVHLESDLDPNLLERPYFLVDNEDTTNVNFDTQGEGSFQVEVYVPSRLPNGSTTPAGTQILITLSGIRADGSEHIVHLPALTARIGRSTYAHVENSILKALINGSMQISYELQFPLGTVLGTSRRLTVTIFGTVSTMPAVNVVEDDAGLIDPSIDYITVEFPEYTPYDRNYSVTLRMEAMRTGGGVEFYEQTLLAGAPPPPTRFRIVPRSEFQRFVGLGDVKIFYRVDDGLVGVLGGSGALTVRESEHLIVHFGERVAELPKPQLDRVDERGNLDPDDVIGQAIVTLPYVRTSPGDTFIWRWVGTGVNGSTGDSILLNGSSAGRPVVFGVDKVFVDNNRNGEIRLSYTLIPASGGALRSETLIVSVGQALGDLLRPEVLEASRNPDQLTPEAVTQGATIRVTFPQMLPTDRIRAVWTGIPDIGSHSETKDGNSHKTLDFTVPADVVGANIAPFGRQISVQYFLLRGTLEIPSLILDLLLLNLNTLPIPTIEGVGDVPILDLSRLTGTERTMINTWHFIHRNQRMWMEYTGTYADPEGTYFEATYTNNLVTADGEVNGILPPTPVDELRKLKDESTLTVKFWVSFDRGSNKANAVLFRERRYTVQALPSELPAPRFHNLPGASLSIYPLQYEHYAFVAVAYEGMNSTHFIELQWIYPDCTLEPISGKNGLDGGRVDFPISARIIANSVGKTITLRYVATIRTDRVTSAIQELTVQMIRPENLPQPLINGLPDGGVLDLADFNGPAKASVSKWPLSFINQRVWLTCSSPGVDDLKVLESYPINSGEAAAGLVNKDVARDWFSGVQNNGSITVSCDVTLDGSTEKGGQPFPLTTYTVKREMRIIKNIPVGTSPSAIVSNSAGTRVYVANDGSHSISVIDTGTNEVIHIITGISGPGIGLAISPDGSRLYVSFRSSNVRCINTANYATLFSTTVTGSRALTVNAAGTRLYVVSNLGGHNGTCVVLSALNGGRVGQFLTNSTYNNSVLANPDDTRGYFGSYHGVAAFDAQSFQLYPELLNGEVRGTMAYSQNSVMGSRLYIPDHRENKIIITNTDRLTNARELIGVSEPHSIAIDPITYMAYFTQQSANNVKIINTHTEEEVGQINGFNKPEGITILPSGVIYVANYGNNTVSVVSN